MEIFKSVVEITATTIASLTIAMLYGHQCQTSLLKQYGVLQYIEQYKLAVIITGVVALILLLAMSLRKWMKKQPLDAKPSIATAADPIHQPILQAIETQVQRENELVNQRVTWSLQVNNFLIIATAVYSTKKSSPPGTDNFELFVLYVIPAIGIGMCVAALAGVHAANKQLDYLINQWKELNSLYKINGLTLIRPYGDRRGRKRGQWPGYAPLGLLISGWLSFLVINTFGWNSIKNIICQ